MKTSRTFTCIIFSVIFLTNTFCQDFVFKTAYFAPNVVSYSCTGNITFTAIIDGEEPDEIYLFIDNVKHYLIRIGLNSGSGPSGVVYQVSLDAQSLIDKLTKDDVNRLFVGYLEIIQDGQLMIKYNQFLQIWDESIPMVEIKETANGLFYSQSIINVVRDFNIDTQPSLIQDITKSVYNDFNDDYDFISYIIVPGYNYYRTHTVVSNDIQGIGLDIYNNSRGWGSEGKLKGYTTHPLPNFFDGACQGFSHETGHQWINYLFNTPYEMSIFHWPYGSISTSMMGISLGGQYGAGGHFPYDLLINTNEYKFIPSTETFYTGQYFKDLDLYLMGLIPPDQVADNYIFKYKDSIPAINYVYTSSDFIKYSIEDLIGAVGERIPNSTTSQKGFNILTIVISPERLTPIEFAFYDYFTKRAEGKEKVSIHEGLGKGYANPFFLATRGLATLDTKIYFTNKLSVTPSNKNVMAEAGCTTFDISSNTSWTVNENAEWLTISPSSGSGNETITVTYTVNPETTTREGTITISASGVSSQIATITQGCRSTLTVSPTQIIDDGCNLDNHIITITSNTNWTITDDAEWLTVSPTHGTGNGSITVTCGANPQGDRYAIINIAISDGLVQEVNISQAGFHWVTVSPEKIDVQPGAGSADIYVYIIPSTVLNMPWTITDDADWLEVSPSNGYESQFLSATFTANTLTSSRTGTIRIVTCSWVSELKVTQGSTTPISITPENNDVGSEAGSTKFSIISNTTWTVADNADWLTLNPTTDSGNGSITVTYTANILTTSRVGTITVSASGASSKTSTVTQTGAPLYLTISSASLSLNSVEGTSSTFTVTSNTSWTVTSSEIWLTLSNGIGSGDAAITLIAQKNPTTNPRTATISISATGIATQIITVNQEGSPTGIKGTYNSNIIVYPNPTNTILFFDGVSLNSTIYIIDINGKLCLNKILAEKRVDISGLSSGVYTIILKNKQEVLKVRFVKL